MITNGRQVVNGTAERIANRSHKYSILYVNNDDDTKDLFVGGPEVTVLNGLKVARLTAESFELPPLNDVYMVSDGGAHTISWMRIEKD